MDAGFLRSLSLTWLNIVPQAAETLYVGSLEFEFYKKMNGK